LAKTNTWASVEGEEDERVFGEVGFLAVIDEPERIEFFGCVL
jgi:hypothetical protein